MPISLECRAATPKEHEFTAQQLRAHTEAEIHKPVVFTSFGVVAYDEGVLVGSVMGKSYLDWLQIDLFWVQEGYRRKGLGKTLMQATIDNAKKAGLHGIEVWTQSWQAPEFYIKQGFKEIAVMDDFIPGKKRHAFRYALRTA